VSAAFYGGAAVSLVQPARERARLPFNQSFRSEDDLVARRVPDAPVVLSRVDGITLDRINPHLSRIYANEAPGVAARLRAPQRASDTSHIGLVSAQDNPAFTGDGSSQ
jgi:hypothetical protein